MEKRRDKARTIGVIARELGEPIHRIEYVVRTRGIEPECLAGHIRVFGDDAVGRIAGILRQIDATQEQHKACRTGEALDAVLEDDDRRPFRRSRH